MIYKFNCKKQHLDSIEFKIEDELLLVTMIQDDNGEYLQYDTYLAKEDVFKLIGALHCIQKDMK
jgi:hypothetical protein